MSLVYFRNYDCVITTVYVKMHIVCYCTDWISLHITSFNLSADSALSEQNFVMVNYLTKTGDTLHDFRQVCL